MDAADVAGLDTPALEGIPALRERSARGLVHGPTRHAPFGGAAP
jgi:hypothetical protein